MTKPRGIAMTLLAALAASAALLHPAPAAAQAITFQDVLAAPDDPEINIAFARQEIAAGRLEQAASALERMLLNQPDWDAARLMYGIVLYRLDDLLGAVRELEKLAERDLPPVQEADRVRYLRLARAGEQPLTISGSVALGARHDSNPNLVSANPSARAGRPLANREDDVALTAGSTLRAEYDLGTGRGDYLFATLGGQLRDYFEFDSPNLATLGATAGANLFLGDGQLSVFGIYGTGFQDYDEFREASGAGANYAFELTGRRTRTRFTLGGAAVHENYDATGFSGIDDDRDGWLATGSLGVAHYVTDRHRLSLGGSYDRKNAENKGFSYDRYTISAGYLALLGSGVYLDTTVSYADLDYDAPNGFQTFARAREDETWRVRAALGSPLETIFGLADIELPRAIGTLVLQGGVTYTDRNSNVARYDFENVGADVLLVRRFQF